MKKLQKDSSGILVRHQNVDIEALLTSMYGASFSDYRKAFNRAQQYYNYSNSFPKFPLTISLELSNKCNLQCSMCFQSSEAAKKQKFVALTSETIQKILQECKEKNLPSLILGAGTEFLVSKNAPEVIKMLGSCGIMDVFLRTNGILLDAETVKLIFAAKVTRVFISLDAATKTTYQEIRGSDALTLIENNINHLLNERKIRGSVLPIVRVSFVVLDKNKHEQKLFLEKWKDKVDFVDFQRFQDLTHVRDKETIIKDENIINPRCAYPFYSLSIAPDGSVAPCCTFYGKELPVGNIHRQSIEEIWNSKRMNQIRGEISSRKLNDVCKRCLFFRDSVLQEDIS